MSHKRCTKVGLDPHNIKKGLIESFSPNHLPTFDTFLWSNCKSIICRMSQFDWLTRCFGTLIFNYVHVKINANALAPLIIG